MNTKQKPKQKSPPHVWVVELKEGGKYAPCACCNYELDPAVAALAERRERWPDDTFRIAKYVRVEQ